MLSIKVEKPVRSYTGEMWRTNKSNKSRLVEDFNSRCGYCDDLDKYSGGYAVYHVEHFAPKDKFPEAEFLYDNLLYACPYCNIAKSNKWIGDTREKAVINNRGFVDPCDDEYYIHLGRDDSGRIIYKTDLGKYMYEELNLHLIRHEINFKMGQMESRIEALKSRIELMDAQGQDASKHKAILQKLGFMFYEYFQELTSQS